MGNYRDYSLQKKLVTALCLCIIIPLLVLGIVLNTYVERRSRKKEYQINQMLIEQVAGNLDNFFQNTQELKYDCLTNFHIQNLITQKGDVEDYASAGDWMNTVIRSGGYYQSISILKDRDVLLQKGDYLNTEEAEEVSLALSMPRAGFWRGPRSAKRASGEKGQEDIVLSYYCGINNYENVSRVEAALVLNVKEAELSENYGGFVNPQSVSTELMDENGKILSSTRKEDLGTMAEYSQEIVDAYQKQGNGYATLGSRGHNEVAFYYKSPVTGWYFVNIVPRQIFMNEERTGMRVVFFSVCLCLLFGVIFAWIQRHYLIEPIGSLVVKIQQVKRGDFIRKQENYPLDEIGMLEQEFDQMSARLKKLIEEVYTTKIKEQEAELNALIAQINPHFLYNTLDSIHWKAIKNKDYMVADQLEALSGIFRHVLSKGRDLVTLESELEFINNYMEIMQARFGKRVKMEIQAEPGLEQVMIPKLIFQPLIENGILHGLEPKKEGGRIWITVSREDNQLMIQVCDDGVGVDEEQLKEQMKHGGKGFALKNINDRLKLRYGEHYGLTFRSEPRKGTAVVVRLPIEEERV